MRNLKRVLSLALAVVMVIGMMVMTTGAADLNDYDEISYVEAVDVMSALGILEGDENSNFNPTDILTREQAAQMALNTICTPMVEYETKGSSISVNGAEIVFGSSKPAYVTTTLAKEQRISTQTLTNSSNYTVEFGEKYFPDLAVVATTDGMERYAHEWMLKKDTIRGGTVKNYAQIDLQALTE